MGDGFSLGQRVRIKELNRPGRVLAIFIGDTGYQYKVRYFDDGDAKEVYFFTDELEEVPA